MAQRRTLLGAAILALAALAVLQAACSAFVAAPVAGGRHSLRGVQAKGEALPAAPAAAPAQPTAAAGAAALAGAFALAAEPALAADYDERQGEASFVLILVIIAAVVITAGFVVVLTNMYK
eukprot:CAMPEP_0179116830 /NCGR_PEP_ID=MMETSP0796-20121207/54830_1 /TAXON_ID=73915 /ORGANISM="Pyrodinium bahamense, Strain pbaha01" /LENGTH=120 /DNA_ID=CAMNT_0020815149 /DNA_START=74 /DNA_END=436 /DNA_ORIENTATION=+